VGGVQNRVCDRCGQHVVAAVDVEFGLIVLVFTLWLLFKVTRPSSEKTGGTVSDSTGSVDEAYGE